jgi:hypothetical protein
VNGNLDKAGVKAERRLSGSQCTAPEKIDVSRQYGQSLFPSAIQLDVDHRNGNGSDQCRPLQSSSPASSKPMPSCDGLMSSSGRDLYVDSGLPQNTNNGHAAAAKAENLEVLLRELNSKGEGHGRTAATCSQEETRIFSRKGSQEWSRKGSLSPPRSDTSASGKDFADSAPGDSGLCTSIAGGDDGNRTPPIATPYVRSLPKYAARIEVQSGVYRPTEGRPPVYQSASRPSVDCMAATVLPSDSLAGAPVSQALVPNTEAINSLSDFVPGPAPAYIGAKLRRNWSSGLESDTSGGDAHGDGVLVGVPACNGTVDWDPLGLDPLEHALLPEVTW